MVKDSLLSTIADIVGIISFILTIVLLIYSEALRKEIESQRQDYVKEQRIIKETLMALRANIVEDGLLNKKIISDIRTQLFTFQQKFKRLLSLKDKIHISKTLVLLRHSIDEINQEALCAELDYFVARFERKERKK